MGSPPACQPPESAEPPGNSNPSFGRGVKGYAKYFGTSYTVFFVADMMTEGNFPSLLHQAPPAGNSAAIAVSMAYDSDNRTASDGISRRGTQLGLDMASNIIKEFWPDSSRHFSKKP